VHDPEYTIKLEGVRQIGYSTILMGGVRDPYILAQIDSWLAQLDDNIKTRIRNTVGDRPYEIVTRVYGRDGAWNEEPVWDQRANWGWRVAVMVPAAIALLAIYVRATCPESPYWVRAQDRKRRIAETLAARGALNEDDRIWYTKIRRVGIRQVFMPDVLPATLVALFVACSSCCIFGTVGSWMPYYLSTEKHWSTQEYSAFYVCWGIVGFFGLWLAGWLSDRIGRRVGFIAMLIQGAIFMTLWVYTDSNILLWVFGLAWSFGFLGFWGPSTTLTAEVFPTRIRGAANGVVWAIAYFVGFVLWPFVTVALQQSTGSFALAFLCIPAFMVAMAIGVWLWVPEHAGKELNAIIV
jgi:sugar phosphate permease